MEYTDEQLESIYDKMVENIPDAMQSLENTIRSGMPYGFIADRILKDFTIPHQTRKGIALAIEWKYRQIENSAINN